MSEFDPYHKWLGIAPHEQPPHHYRLLGISPFEADADVIDAASNKQMVFLRGCSTGSNAAFSQKLLDEVAAVRLCLLNPEKKNAYDRTLMANLNNAQRKSEAGKQSQASRSTAALRNNTPWQGEHVARKKDDDFDGYRKWLAIPEAKLPPTHYQLLGVSLDEEDPEVICAAAEQRRHYVGSKRGEGHDAAVTEIVYRINEAEATLLDPEMRRDYDRQMRLFEKRRKKRQVDPFASRSDGTSPSRLGPAQGTGILKTFAGIMVVIVLGFGVMAWFSFQLPWSMKPKPVEVAPIAAPVQRPVLEQGKENLLEPKAVIPGEALVPVAVADKPLEIDEQPLKTAIEIPDVQIATANPENDSAKPNASDLIVGVFHIDWDESGKQGTSNYQFKPTKAVLKENREVGTWELQGEVVVINYSDSKRGKVRIEFRDRNTFRGTHTWASGLVSKWTAKRMATPISNGYPKEDSGRQTNGTPKSSQAARTLTDKRDVISLFDGKTLNGWKVSEFNGGGRVRVQGNNITLSKSSEGSTGITWNGEFPKDDYEVSVEAKRVDGNDFFCGITFPVDNAECTLIVGGWGGTVVGLSAIDGQNASANASTKKMQFDNGRWYSIRLSVTQQRIQCWIDDTQLIDQSTAGHRLSILPQIEPSRPFGIAAYRTTAALRNIERRAIRKTNVSGKD